MGPRLSVLYANYAGLQVKSHVDPTRGWRMAGPNLAQESKDHRVDSAPVVDVDVIVADPMVFPK